jgi:hypothetical protein
VGETTTSLEVVNSILSSALRSMPSAMMSIVAFDVLFEFAGYLRLKLSGPKFLTAREVARLEILSGADQS